ncbi:uncharacterized protein LOC116170187 [Photinus pyralis]|uniref:uncharacterized protein LOC116170187 n=1 Tax=Photinus pyralis TaxID=7054 RepID=UPI001266FCDA|nr:uncharacterized protein LOC116170187 [Photinus pyralis]
MKLSLYFVVVTFAKFCLCDQDCFQIRDAISRPFHKIKNCAQSIRPTIAKVRVRTVAQCAEYAVKKRGFAFNWQRKGSRSKPEANCEILDCLTSPSSLIDDSDFDYHSIYGRSIHSKRHTFSVGVCVGGLGVFTILEKKMNYTSAVETCQSLGGDLANIASSSRTRELSKLLNEKLTDWYKVAYVGLYIDADGTSFITPEGVSLDCFTFRAWGPGQPRFKNTQRCVVLDSNGFWKLFNCSTPLAAVCEIFPVPPSVLCALTATKENLTCLHQGHLTQCSAKNMSRLSRSTVL